MLRQRKVTPKQFLTFTPDPIHLLKEIYQLFLSLTSEVIGAKS